MSITVGLTYDLKSDYLARGYTAEQTAELDQEDTIEGLEQAIRAAGYTPERIGSISDLVGRLAAGHRWELVFNIAEGMHSMSREVQVPALLEAYRIPYTFSDPIVLAVTHQKGLAKEVLLSHGVSTPAFAVVRDLSDLDGLSMDFPLFAKPIAEGTGKGVSTASRISSREELQGVCGTLLDRFGQPVLVEEYLPGREFTVGLIGNGASARALGAMEVFYNRDVEPIYSYSTKANYEHLVTYGLASGPIAEECCALALKAFRVLGCRDAARVDVRLDRRGAASFIEINALPGLNPVHSDLPILCRFAGMEYNVLISEILGHAIARHPDLGAPSHGRANGS